jgi:non-haem Fe2+, alpha-ketoglutarate-dependent halogenase
MFGTTSLQSGTISERMEADGFCGPLDAGVSLKECQKVAESIEWMIENRACHPLYDRFSVRDWHLVDRSFLDLLTAPNILAAVAELFGEQFQMWRSKIFLKTPGEGPLGWHQEWGAFNGEEIGNDRPALIPSREHEEQPWNVTVWMPLSDVDETMGPIRFGRGTHKRRFPIEMRPLTEAEFYVDPFHEVQNADELITRVKHDSLCLDIPTSSYFDDIDVSKYSYDDLCDYVRRRLNDERGAVTLDFDDSEHDIVSMPMRAGQFVMFSERCMHGSSANMSDHNRIGINARYTFLDTKVYPFRHSDNPVDGSNLDVTLHRTVLISAQPAEADGAAISLPELRTSLHSDIFSSAVAG